VIPVLETQRLLMRGWRESDLDVYASIYADEDTARYIGGACPREEAWRRMTYVAGNWLIRGFGFFALVEKASGECIGWCGPYYPEGWPDREIGWTLVPSARGKGFAAEAARRALDFAYRDLGWTSAISFIALSNSASIAVAHRLRASLESTRIYRGFESGVFRHRGPADLSSPHSISRKEPLCL
jgi:RimJ/RimL family protein N-acetyltransferase